MVFPHKQLTYVNKLRPLLTLHECVLFLDFGGASQSNQAISQITLVFATPQYLVNFTNKNETMATKTNDIFSLLIGLIDLLDKKLFDWLNSVDKKDIFEYARIILERRNDKAIEVE